MSDTQIPLKVSFDFDGTLSRESIQRYAKELVDAGLEVWIVTARFEDPDNYNESLLKQYGIKDVKKEHLLLFDIAKDIGILPQHIKFMNMRNKAEFFTERGDFLWHLDDDCSELYIINRYTDIVSISCENGSNWRHKCDRLIKKKLNQ